MKITVESHINIPRNLAKVEDKKYWTFAANEWHRFITPYVPMDTGTLAETVNINSSKLYGEVEYLAPYAHRMYENNYNFRKDKHKLASAHWDKAAEPTQKPKLIAAMQDYADSGRLNLNG